MIVLQAVRERKRYEQEINRPMLKDKLSQTGWKLRENFMKKSNNILDDKDRIDVFNSTGATAEVTMGGGTVTSGGGVLAAIERADSESSGDVIILEY